jgi:GNS1/SUR4 family
MRWGAACDNRLPNQGAWFACSPVRYGYYFAAALGIKSTVIKKSVTQAQMLQVMDRSMFLSPWVPVKCVDKPTHVKTWMVKLHAGPPGAFLLFCSA